MKLVLSPHLARSFHHLFPVAPFSELKDPVKALPEPTVSSNPQIIASNNILDSKLRLSAADEPTTCFACLRLIGVPSKPRDDGVEDEGEEMLRYKCPECKNVFCVNCDSFLHDALHNCPGCLLKA